MTFCDQLSFFNEKIGFYWKSIVSVIRFSCLNARAAEKTGPTVNEKRIAFYSYYTAEKHWRVAEKRFKNPDPFCHFYSRLIWKCRYFFRMVFNDIG